MKIPLIYKGLAVLAAGIPSLLAQNTFVGGGADNDWSTALNWDPAEPTLITENVFLYNGVTADITQAGEIGNIIYVGDALDGATDASATINMTGGALEAISLRIGTDSDSNGTAADPTIEGVFNFIDGTILLAEQGNNSQALQIGSTNTNNANTSSVTGTFTMGSATTSPTLTIANNRLEVGTGDGVVTGLMTVKSGTVTVGNGDDNIVVGQGTIDGTSTFIIGEGTGTATVTTNGTGQLNMNDGTGTVAIGGGGTLDIDDLQFQDNASAPDSVVNVTTGGTLIIRDQMNDRAGGNVLNIDGGTVRFDSLTTDVREVEELNLGSTGAGSTIAITAGTVPIDLLTGAASSVGGGTHNVQVDAVQADSIDTGGQPTFWLAGTDTWDGASAKWAAGLNPNGVIPPGGGIPVIISLGSLSGAGSATWSVTGAAAGAFSGVTVGASDGTTPESLITLNHTAGLDLGTLKARIAFPGATITRSGDLRIARDAYHSAATGAAGFAPDAQELIFDEGTLDVTGEIVIGGLFERTEVDDGGGAAQDPRVFTNLGGVVDAGNVVTQTGGSIITAGMRFYNGGSHPTPDPGATAAGTLLPAFDAHLARGGTYNLNGGTLTVNGDILEGDPGSDANAFSVDQAQFHVDGGTLDFNGSLIQVQSFRTGHAAPGSFTLASGKTLKTTGTFFAANNSAGTFIAEAGSTLELGLNSGDPFKASDAANGDGTFISDGATITTTGIVRITDRGLGSVELNAGTVWTNTAGDYRVADGDPAGDDAHGGAGTLEMNGDAAIVQSGGNFETADFPDQGARNTVTEADGAIIMNDDARIVIGTNNFILGQQRDTIARLDMDGGTLDLTVTDLAGTPRGTAGQFNINDGNGTLDMTAGTIRSGLVQLARNNGSCDIAMSGGIWEVTGNFNFRDGGADTLALSGSATLEVSATLQCNNPSSAASGYNEITITGSNVVLKVGKLISDADTRFTFVADAAGFSALNSGDSIGMNGLPLVIDGSALATAADMGTRSILFAVTTTQNGSPFKNDAGVVINEGDQVATAGDGSPLFLTYAGGDGNDVALFSSLPTGDNDGDKIQNLVEVAFDTDPNDPNSGPEGLPTVTSAGGNATLRFRQLDTPGSITYTIEESSDLGQADPWTTVAGTPALAGDQAGAGPNSSIYELTIPAAGGTNFVRVRIGD